MSSQIVQVHPPISQLKNFPEETSIPSRWRLWICTKDGKTVELLHNFFQFIFSFLEVEMPPYNRVLTCEFNDLLAVKVVE